MDSTAPWCKQDLFFWTTRFAAGVHLLKSRASYVDMRARSGRKRKSWEFLVFYRGSGPGHYEIPPHVSHDGEDGHLLHSSSASRLTAGASGFLNFSQSLVLPDR